MPEAASRAVLAALGLAQVADYSEDARVELATSSVPGFYSPRDKLITLIEPEDPASVIEEDQTLLLAHEFVHAIQDEEVDLEALSRQTEPTFDASLAELSAVEGEAQMLQGLFMTGLLGLGDYFDLRRFYTSWVSRAEQEYSDISPLLASPRYFPYTFGARYMYDLLVSEGRDATHARVGAPPTSTLAVLTDPTRPPDVEPFDYRGFPAAVGELEPAGSNRLGAWIVGKYVERVAERPDLWQALAGSWRGDRLFFYAGPEGEFAGLWSLRFATTEAAEGFARAVEPALEQNLTGVDFVEHVGRDVTLAALGGADTALQWQEALRAGLD